VDIEETNSYFLPEVLADLMQREVKREEAPFPLILEIAFIAAFFVFQYIWKEDVSLNFPYAV
jgi:hypothetical protein